MRKIITTALLTVAMLHGAVKAITVDIYPTVDTYVSASSTTSNYGTGQYLYVQNSPSLLALLKADLTTIPVNATITKVELYLRPSAVTGTSSVFYFDKVTQSWGETTATYANKPTATATGRVSKSGLSTSAAAVIDITAFAQGWYASPVSNYGLQISAAASGNSATFYSCEFSGTTSLRPVVKVTYSTYVAPIPAVDYIPSRSIANNYIATISPRTAVTSVPDITLSRSPASYPEDIRYFDGLGRPVLTVSVCASPTGKDIVTEVGYDEAGRQVYDYLPFTKASNNGAFIATGTCATDRTSFYGRSAPEGVAYEANAAALKATKVFENSPLDRLLKQGLPGADWQPDAATPVRQAGEHVVSFEYGTNTAGNVYILDGTGAGVFTKTGTYAAGTLHVNTTTDENGQQVREYKDLQGQVVLKEAYDGGQWLRTYYVYDDFGLLRFVVPPLAQVDLGYYYFGSTINLTDTWVRDLCYYYEYDPRKRMVIKKLPGADEVYMVYDNRDRLVLTQDGVQRGSNQWSFTKYDALNRPVMTGVLTSSTAVGTIRANFDAETGRLYETAAPTTEYLYSYNSSYPSAYPVLPANIYTITYYDSYPSYHSGIGYTRLTTDYDASASTATTGMATLVKTRPLTTGTSFTVTNAFTVTKNFYDKYGRVIGTTTVDYNNLTTIINNKYDFTGNLLKTQKQVKNGTTEIVAVAQRMVYDHRNRLLEAYHKIGTNAEVLLAQNRYNELGQLMEKRTGMPDFNKPYLQYTDYSYNIRGWLSGINNSTVSDGEGDLFGMELLYNTAHSQLANGTLFNGNIAGMVWTISGLDKKGYSFTYDGLNRLKTSYYKQGSSLAANAGYYNEDLAYDANGNIATLTRYDNNVLIDNLSYVYNSTGKSNKLLYVNDAATTAGFNNRNTTTQDFYYDNNGNLTKDLNKWMTVAYNYLNLPNKLNTLVGGFSDCLEYLYDASGVKLAKRISGTSNLYEYYMGDVILKKTAVTDAFSIEYLTMPEGRVDFGSGSPVYEYHLKDHLGNTRVAYIAGANGAADAVQEADYYPFGMKMASALYENNANKYLYNGKELQDNLLGNINLDWYDYGARFYDPALARFHTVDPLTEKNHSQSGFVYAANNPIKYIDYMGLDSAQRATAVAMAEEYVEKNTGNTYPTQTANGGGGDRGQIISVANGMAAAGPVGAMIDIGGIVVGKKSMQYITIGYAFGFGATAGIGYAATDKNVKMENLAGRTNGLSLSIPFTPVGIERFGDLGDTEGFGGDIYKGTGGNIGVGAGWFGYISWTFIFSPMPADFWSRPGSRR